MPISHIRIFHYLTSAGAAGVRGDGGTEAEFIVLKCIKDGVVDAYVTHDQSSNNNNSSGACFHSKDLLNVYGTAEASMSIGKRVEFCLRTRRDAMKAMRYDQPSEKKSTISGNGAGAGGSDSGSTADAPSFDGDGALDMMDDEMDF